MRNLPVSEQLALIQSKGLATLYDTVRDDTPHIVKDHQHALVQMFSELNGRFPTNLQMSPRAIAGMVDDICDCEFAGLSLEELNIFLRRVRTGYYGQFYGGMNQLTIMEWLRSFWNEHRELFYEFHDEKHMELKRQWGSRDI